MASGTPVVAFNKGSMPELIDHGQDGFLAENIDEAIEMVKNIGFINRKVCRKKVEDHFSKERMCQNYLEVYRQILNK